MTPRETLAANVKKLMVAAPALDTQAKLAKATAGAVSQKTVSNVLNATGPAPTITTVAAIAKAFRVAPWRLLHPQLGLAATTPEELALHQKLEEAYAALQAIKAPS